MTTERPDNISSVWLRLVAYYFSAECTVALSAFLTVIYSSIPVSNPKKKVDGAIVVVSVFGENHHHKKYTAAFLRAEDIL